MALRKTREPVRFVCFSREGKHSHTVPIVCNVYRRKDGTAYVFDRRQRVPVYWEFGYPTVEIVR